MVSLQFREFDFEVTLHQLPEDALLEVMQYLSIKDLLACRLLCRRLGGLALNPYVWRWRSLERYAKCSVLRLAPCLASVHVFPFDETNCDLITTSCAIEELFIELYREGSGAAMALLVRVQASLGRLRRVNVKLDFLRMNDAANLLPTLASTVRLEHLSLSVQERRPIFHDSCPQVVNVPSSMRSFQFDYFEGLDKFVRLVLSTHAATLETVELTKWTPRAILEQLPGLPRLRDLTCPLLYGLADLEASESLEVLTLKIGESYIEDNQKKRLGTAAGVQLLHKAHRLRVVSFKCIELYNVGITIKLLRTLASGKSSSSVESLSFECMCRGQDGLNRALVQALPQLPALRELCLNICDFDDVSESYDELLRVISPACTPSLCDLYVVGARPCTHALAHSDSVRALLAANPTLHVRTATSISVVCGLPDVGCGRAVCETCSKLSCHDFLSKVDIRDKSFARYACLVLEEPSPNHSKNCLMVKVS